MMQSIATTYAQSKLKVTDGPYIEWAAEGLSVLWLEKSKLKKQKVKGIENEKFDVLDFPITVRDKQAHNPVYEYSDVKKIAAISDIHGQYDVMLKLFTSNDIINEELEWSFGDGHLVITGDIFDRGEQVTEILWFIYELEQQAQDAGGKVHMLLGNHEVMVMSGDIRYIHKKYRYTTALTKRMYQDLFGENTVLGNWLRTKPVAISINDIVFLHAGFSKDLLELGYTIKDVNKTFCDQLIGVPAAQIVQDSTLAALYTDQGPLWYRGYLDIQNFTKKDAKHILKKLGKKHIVVGHTSMKSIVSLYGERIFMIDSSIKFGKSGEVLLWENDTFSRGTIFGETISIEPHKFPKS